VGSVLFEIAFEPSADSLTVPAGQQVTQNNITPNTAQLVRGQKVSRCRLVFLDFRIKDMVYGLVSVIGNEDKKWSVLKDRPGGW
jgi:hypothetical protein